MANTDKSGKSKKRLAAAKELNRVVTEHYMACARAKTEGKPVGWMPPMNGAIEIFYAMDLQPLFPENWSPCVPLSGLPREISKWPNPWATPVTSAGTSETSSDMFTAR